MEEKTISGQDRIIDLLVIWVLVDKKNNGDKSSKNLKKHIKTN